MYLGCCQCLTEDSLLFRGFSTFHALLVAAASLYLLIESDLFRDGAPDDLMINRTSAFSDTILGVLMPILLSLAFF